jgi:hypothetical protein
MGNKYILTVTDLFTNYAKICAIPNKEAETLADMVFTKWICRYGFPSIIHTDGGKEFINKIAAELYSKLEIKGIHTPPAHLHFDSQVEVIKKTLAKYMKNVVDKGTLNFEWYLAPLMLCYNTSYHRTIKRSHFEHTYGMKPRLPSFPVPELSRINYGKGFVAERLQLLKKARQIAVEQSMQEGDDYKKDHNSKAKLHDLEEGDYAYLDNQLFFGEKQKICTTMDWTTPSYTNNK